VFVAIIGIGVLRIVGSAAFQTRIRYRKALSAVVFLVLPFSHGDIYATFVLILLIFLGGLVPFGLYVMISLTFASARRDPRGHERKVARMAISLLIFAALLFAAAPYLGKVVPQLN
jgi:hypothetical protein